MQIVSAAICLCKGMSAARLHALPRHADPSLQIHHRCCTLQCPAAANSTARTGPAGPGRRLPAGQRAPHPPVAGPCRGPRIPFPGMAPVLGICGSARPCGVQIYCYVLDTLAQLAVMQGLRAPRPSPNMLQKADRLHCTPAASLMAFSQDMKRPRHSALTLHRVLCYDDSRVSAAAGAICLAATMHATEL